MDTRIAKSPPASLFTLVTDRWTRPFWDAAREHRLVAPRCSACASFRMPPTPFCPHCRSQAIDWAVLSGRGTIYSYSVVSRAIVPEMEDRVPYVTAVIELPDAGGVRLITNVVGSPVDEVKVGAPVHVVWEAAENDVVVPRFALDGHGAPA